MQTAGGADAEKSTTVYVTFNPSTGQASSRTMPGVTAASASPEQAALLVSTDRHWAIPDTEISHGEENSGKLKVYSLTTGQPLVVDIRQRSGQRNLKAIGWAFDPQRADTLRIVDTANRIWTVNVPGGRATQEGTLPKGPWVFTNGFNRNTGQPWVESIDSDATKPPGNGSADTSPGHARRWHRPSQRLRGPHQAARQPLPARGGLHRCPRHDLDLLRGQAGDLDLLPAQGRAAVDGLRQAEHVRGARRREFPAGAPSRALNLSRPVDILAS